MEQARDYTSSEMKAIVIGCGRVGSKVAKKLTKSGWEVTAVDEAGVTIAATGGHIQVTRVRPEGGQKVSAGAFAKSAGLRPGARLGAT